MTLSSIQKRIPVLHRPNNRPGERTATLVARYAQMATGDSFDLDLPGIAPQQAQNIALTIAARYGYRVTTSKLDGRGIRVWLLAKP